MHKNIILKNLLSLAIILIVFSPSIIAAQTNPPPGGAQQPSVNPINFRIKIDNPFNCGGQSPCTIESFIRVIIRDILIPIGGVIAVIMIMYAGFLYVTAGGDTTKIKKAHDALLWSVIGAAILLGAWVISTAIEGTIKALSK
ncbi:MAG: pilin [Patescibacteria group bacterium]